MFKYLRERTPEVRSRNYWVFATKKTNQMANRTLNFEAGNGNWWRPCNCEKKFLIDWSRTYSLLNTLTYILLTCRKLWFKNCGKLWNWFGFLITYSGGNFWCPCWRTLPSHKIYNSQSAEWQRWPQIANFRTATANRRSSEKYKCPFFRLRMEIEWWNWDSKLFF